MKKNIYILKHTHAIFHGQIYSYTAGFELFGRGHGHLATLSPFIYCITSTHRSKGWNVLRTFVRGHIVGASSVQASEKMDRRNNERQCIRFCTIWKKHNSRRLNDVLRISLLSLLNPHKNGPLRAPM
jgi:hypothetical protein